MSVTNLSAMPADLTAVGPLAVATVAAAPDAPDAIEAIVAASSSRSAKLSTSMTQLLLETPADTGHNRLISLKALFRPKR
ncbi:hypothetical protein [Sphingomonas elodea]|uniref:hypothetical protein n=1 Tax=Sphingomonas elodea TaxID=179878 RepID=UPI0002630AC8|nr:hypothetical protein [Sphingomonas elodea]